MRSPRSGDPIDHGPKGVGSDPLLGLDRRAPGARGLIGKVALAALAIILMSALVVALWAASHYSRRPELERPPSSLLPR